MNCKPRYLALLFITLAIAGCYYDVEEELYPVDDCLLDNISYSQDILPIIQDNCYVCHDSANNFGGVTLEGHGKLLNSVNNGSLLGAIKHESGFTSMPQGAPKLLDCDISKIEKWVADGAPDN